MLASITRDGGGFERAGSFADHDADDVGVFGEIAIAGAVSDGFDAHGGHGAEANCESGNDSSAGGRGEFHRRAARIDRLVAQQARRGGRGYGKDAVFCASGAAADVDGRA